MTKTRLASSTFVVVLLVSRAAGAQAQVVAQPDSPQWLKDRQYNEGAGIRTGDLELHPGIAGEAGYDSNWFERTDKSGGYQNGASSIPATSAPPIPAVEFRVTPSLYLSTLSPQRRNEDGTQPLPPPVLFRAGANATYREFVGVSSDPAASEPQNDISNQRSIGGAADARLDIAPQRPFGASLYATYSRVVQPNVATADPNLAFTYDTVTAGAEAIAQPGGGTLDWHFGYDLHAAIFEQSEGQPFNLLVNEAYTRGRWLFRPRTALLYDGTVDFTTYTNSSEALTQALVNSTPIRTRIGLNGLVTDRFALLGMIGWGATFLDTSQLPGQQQYDSVIGQAEAKWFFSAGPGIANPGDVGLSLSSIAVGYNRDFVNSFLGNYYGVDRGYLKFMYFFAGRALLTLEGGVGSIEYPNLLWGSDQGTTTGNLRVTAFDDFRVDGTLFGEYRVTDAFGINATIRYTANLSNTAVPVTPTSNAPTNEYDLEWNRIEAFLGVRYFL